MVRNDFCVPRSIIYSEMVVSDHFTDRFLRTRIKKSHFHCFQRGDFFPTPGRNHFLKLSLQRSKEMAKKGGFLDRFLPFY